METEPIPDDLAAAGWEWRAGFLSWRPAPDANGVMICPASFPDVFAQAREFERIRGEVHITSLEIRAKVPKRKRKREKAEPVQEEMSLI